MENPGTSSTSNMWSQKEVQEIMQTTKTVQFDHCQFGLRHPQSSEPLRKNTQLQTTSREIIKRIDQRNCEGNLRHSQIEGSRQFRGKTIAVSRYAAFYPRLFARKVAQSILAEQNEPERPCVESSMIIDMLCPVREAESEPTDEPGTKRARKVSPLEDSPTCKRGLEEYMNNSPPCPEKVVVEKLQSFLPKSGAQIIDLETWPGNFLPEHCQIEHVKEIKAIKGVEKYLIGNQACTHCQTIRPYTPENTANYGSWC